MNMFLVPRSMMQLSAEWVPKSMTRNYYLPDIDEREKRDGIPARC